jgi:hypothetical protein
VRACFSPLKERNAYYFHEMDVELKLMVTASRICDTLLKVPCME